MDKIKLILILFFTAAIVSAQSRYTDPRSIAMGNSFSISSQGIYSIQSNPANLVLTKNIHFEFSTLLPLPSVNANAGNDFMTLDDLDYYFGGVRNSDGSLSSRYLDETEKNNLKSLFSNGAGIRTNVVVNLLSFSIYFSPQIGAIGFSISDLIGQKGNISNDLIDLILFGNEKGRTYNFDDLSFNSSYIREFTFTYARELTNILPGIFKNSSVGISLSYLQGYAYLNVERANTQLETQYDNTIKIDNDFLANIAVSPDFGINWDFAETNNISRIGPFPKPAGTGLGIGLGFSGEIDSIWSFGLSVTDIGSVSWNEETVSYSSDGLIVITDISDSTITDSLENSLTPSGAFSDGFSSSLPTALRVGIGLQLDKFLHGNFPGKLFMVLSYTQGFNNVVMNTTKPIFSFGFEWDPVNVILIRSGIIAGGINNFTWSFGLGLDLRLLEFNFGTSDILSLFASKSLKRYDVAISSRWKF